MWHGTAMYVKASGKPVFDTNGENSDDDGGAARDP
jgi:hypothetical protein